MLSTIGDFQGGRHPELKEILRYQAKRLTVLLQGVAAGGVHRVRVLGEPGKDIGVQQNVHSPRPS
jgi:hypothetical protein